MKGLYINSISSFSGKTALCLGLGLHMQSRGLKVGYVKPVSKSGYRAGAKLLDEDAEFVQRVLRLEMPAADLSPVIVTDELLKRAMQEDIDTELLQKVEAAYVQASAGKDCVLIEGAANMQDGFAVGLAPVEIVRHLQVQALAVIRWQDDISVLDDAIASKHRIKDNLQGIVINNVPDSSWDYIKQSVVPHLEKKGIRVYGILPHQHQLMAISVGELVDLLNAEVLTGENLSSRLVETLSVGAMTVESALPRFRRQINKAVITGGDRTDLQAAALETSTVCLILTGNLHPSATIIKHAEELGVAVLLATDSTIEVVEKIEGIFGKTRLGQAEKLSRFQAILAEHLDYDRLLSDLQLI